MLNEVLHLTNGAPFAQDNENDIRNELKTSCYGCKYDDCEVDEEERKANCLSCLEPVTIRKNFVKGE